MAKDNGKTQKELTHIEMDVEKREQKPIPYPKSVAFIISNEFCERFNYYGMRTILVLYLTNKLGYNEEAATVLFHTFTMLVYIFPLVGALIADGWMGKYKTILYLSIVYSIGAMIVSFGAVPLEGMPIKLVTIIGLLLIAMGTGGIKPCVSAFGGDQFLLPDQSAQLAKFFSLFYFAINAGSMISTTVTPILREDVHCFGEHDCFSLAFGVPAVLMLVSVLIFIAGKSRYRCNPPAGNMIFGVSQCITDAYKGWRKQRNVEPLPHFLDYAEPTVGPQMVYETKCLAKILVLYLPFPIFWALFDQQGSRWTFQATRMDGDVWGYHIKPDQMQVVNPLLILAFIPLFDYVVYPLLKLIGIKRPLQKLTIGLLLAAMGFFLSAGLEMKMEEPSPLSAPTEPNMTHLRLYNGMPCRYEFTMNINGTSEQHSIEPLGMWSDLAIHLPKSKEYTFKAVSSQGGGKCSSPIEGKLHLHPGKSIGYFLIGNHIEEFADGLANIHSPNSATYLRILINTPKDEGPILLRIPGSSLSSRSLDMRNFSQLHKVSQGYGEVDINGKKVANFETKIGGLYSLLLEGNAQAGYQFKMFEVVSPRSISILWQLPQIVVMTAAEIMFSVTGLEFSFTQAPASMKSVLQACWLLSVAIGNMIVVVIAEIKFVDSQSAEFALFATLMLVDMMIFLFLARNYQYANHSESTENESNGHTHKDASKEEPQIHDHTVVTPRKSAGAEPVYGAYRNHAYDDDHSEA
ncbi:uncharacterized protein Dwil_GK24928, isoform A [Drosophila willistoni]|uniref:Oligopeptide transporter 1 n=1 Tax=Drosophila willistoni TaxID=7260 RepID=B4NDF2_DROWI|nr:peptide transporter family 1 isoform X2 [Drosophila willistoni]EDW82858.1 uncharacterized protein Dwil_GK24928, isoform A [Drosophila willistoni]